ncbi:MAG: hypothetical protein MUF72_05480 [Elainella sp. Prado103]|jgi:hypothetical protein|nr:hypothetical protein [Elainella sp. Prado103]
MLIRKLRNFRSFSRSLKFIGLFTAVLYFVISCSLFGVADSFQTSVFDSSLPYTTTTGLGVGTNLAGIADWSSELPFVDGFKSARKWITKCAAESACGGEWDTQEYDQLDLDDQGWVKSLPDDPNSRHRRVATLLFREIADGYPGGQYVVLYDGTGTIEYEFDARKDQAQSRPGRDLINVTPSQAGIYLLISATDPNQTGDYIRNIRVVPIEYENNYADVLFNPLFLERIKQFGTLRFMDWMATNHSQQKEWSDRPQVEDATYAIKGVPIEIMVELANRLRAHPWFTLPHQATDEYITNFAKLVQQRLDPQLTVYVEFSNEVWNWMFSQAQYALQQGKSRWGNDKGDAYMQWYGMRTAQMSDIWKNVFGNQRDRVISIISTQTSWLGLENSALDCPLWVAEGNKPCYQHQIDAYAITGYFSGELSLPQNQDEVESWLSNPSQARNQAWQQLADGSVLNRPGEGDSIAAAATSFAYHQKVAQAKGLQLLVYEGGQHLVNPESDRLTTFFGQLNRDPQMYELYTQLLTNWQAAGGTLFMNFSDITPFGKWGNWGLLEHVNQDRSSKYDAMMDFIQKNRLR